MIRKIKLKIGRYLIKISGANSYYYGDMRYGNYDIPKYHFFSLINYFGVKLCWGDKYQKDGSYL